MATIYENPAAAVIGYFGYATEWKPGVASTVGTFVTPTRWLPLTSNAFKDAPASVKKQYFSNQRASQRTNKVLKVMAGGAVGFPLFWEAGIDLFCAALGADAYNAAITADAAATYVAASNGRQVITYVTAGAYQVGAPLLVDLGASQEVRTILATDNVAKTITVAEFSKTHSTPITVQQPQGHSFAFSNLPSSNPSIKKSLRALSCEVNEGGFSRQYTTVYAGKFDLKGAADFVEATVDLIGTNPGVAVTPGSETAWAYTTALDTQVDNPFGIVDGSIIVYNDPTAGGTSASAVRTNPYIENWGISFTNGMIQRAFWDSSRAHRAFPGPATLTFDYKADNPSGRFAELDDLIMLNVETPVFGTFAINMGTPSVPVWKIVSLYIPTMDLETAEPIRGLTDVAGVQVKGEARASGADLIKFWVSNETVTAY